MFKICIEMMCLEIKLQQLSNNLCVWMSIYMSILFL